MRPAVALSLWTLFVWATRIRNAVGDDAGLGPIVLSLVFIALAVATLAAVVTGRLERRLLLAFAGWTTVVWVVRVFDIAVLSDHGAAFVIVHAGLGVVSVGLAALAVRAVTATATRGSRRAPA